MNPVSTLVIALSAASLLSACRRRTRHTEAPSARPVLSVVVRAQTSRAVGFAGTIEARYRSDHGFRGLGRIVSRDASVGDVVRKGRRLATLDPVAYLLAVQSAEADLRAPPLISTTFRLQPRFAAHSARAERRLSGRFRRRETSARGRGRRRCAGQSQSRKG